MARIHSELDNPPGRKEGIGGLVTPIEAVFEALGEPFAVNLQINELRGELNSRHESRSLEILFRSEEIEPSEIEGFVDRTPGRWAWWHPAIFSTRVREASSRGRILPETAILRTASTASADHGLWVETSYEAVITFISSQCDPRNRNFYFKLKDKSEPYCHYLPSAQFPRLFPPLLIQFPRKDSPYDPQPDIFLPKVETPPVEMEREDSGRAQKAAATLLPHLEPIWQFWLETQLANENLAESHEEIRQSFEEALSALKTLSSYT